MLIFGNVNVKYSGKFFFKVELMFHLMGLKELGTLWAQIADLCISAQNQSNKDLPVSLNRILSHKKFGLNK